MPLFLNEIWLRKPSPESFAEFIETYGFLGGQEDQLGLTTGQFRLVAGPWMSIEEAKVVFVFDSPNVAETLPAFGRLLAAGLISKRKLTPLVSWEEAGKFVDGL